MNALISRYHTIKNQLPSAVTLLCVSKTKPADDIATLVAEGQRDFGENYLQECLAKQGQLAHLPIVWHYIGHIQRNKTRDIAAYFDWVHTVERVLIAKRLSEQRADDLPPLNVLIQVNIDDESSKSGCQPDEVLALAQAIQGLPKLCLRGLMIIPSKAESDAFVRTKVLFDTIKTTLNLPHWDTLSMGMSGDMAQAVAAGSTMVRVGSAIFGERVYPS